MSSRIRKGWKRTAYASAWPVWSHRDLLGTVEKTRPWSRGICHDANRIVHWNDTSGWVVHAGIHWAGTFATVAQAQRWAQKHTRKE
jgi:hypothetical protein